MTSKAKSGNRLVGWLKRLFFGPQREMSILEEEALQSPMRTIIKKFWSKGISRMAVIVFLLIFLAVMIGPIFLPIDLGYQDNTQQHVAPGLNMFAVPGELRKDIKMISPGITYGAGIDGAGKAYTWGYTKVTGTIDMANIPDEVKQAKLVSIAAGYDHIAALDENGAIYVWGSNRLGQDKLPKEIKQAMKDGVNLDIVQLEAGNQFTIAVTRDGHAYVWGNSNINDLRVKKQYQGNIAKVSANINTFIALTKDGAAVYTGLQSSAYSKIPEGLESGVVDVAGTAFGNAALKEDGTVVMWGNPSGVDMTVPEHEGKIIKIFGGRNHFTALTDKGQVLAWGANNFGQINVPALKDGDRVKEVFTDYYQNYLLTESGELKTFGLSGYLLGTDHLGRDILVRIINGGKVTMTVGAVAVIISLVIGVILGGLAGYFGGWIDLVIMRFAEIVSGMPFLPFALILSAAIGTRMPVEQKVYVIMVVLGLLSWPGLCRLIRAQIFSTREMEFVTAAKAMGVREWNIVFKHIIPNVISTILVSATLSFATSMLTESTLSYLGFGITPPTPTWGNMLTGANNSIIIQQFWWRWVFPAIIFSICTICINLIGDGLRDAIDPKSNDR